MYLYLFLSCLYFLFVVHVFIFLNWQCSVLPLRYRSVLHIFVLFYLLLRFRYFLHHPGIVTLVNERTIYKSVAELRKIKKDWRDSWASHSSKLLLFLSLNKGKGPHVTRNRQGLKYEEETVQSQQQHSHCQPVVWQGRAQGDKCLSFTLFLPSYFLLRISQTQ